MLQVIISSILPCCWYIYQTQNDSLLAPEAFVPCGYHWTSARRYRFSLAIEVRDQSTHSATIRCGYYYHGAPCWGARRMSCSLHSHNSKSYVACCQHTGCSHPGPCEAGDIPNPLQVFVGKKPTILCVHSGMA